MADEKITELAELATTPADDDLVAIVDVSETPDLTKKITVANLMAAGGGGGVVPIATFGSCFEDTARWATAIAASGSEVIDSQGARCITGATANGHCVMRFNWRGDGDDVYDGSPTFACSLIIKVVGSDIDAFCGLASNDMVGDGDFLATQRHIGFKMIRVASGAYNLYATQADGSTENASAVLTTLLSEDNIDLYLKVNGADSVDYYWRKNGGAFSAATNLTSNLPTGVPGADAEVVFNAGNHDAASNSSICYGSFTCTRL